MDKLRYNKKKLSFKIKKKTRGNNYFSMLKYLNRCIELDTLKTKSIFTLYQCVLHILKKVLPCFSISPAFVTWTMLGPVHETS